MTLTLYGSWFSPFARKVALALELKGLEYAHVDALRREFHDQLVQRNARAEVPVLVDEAITVVNSSDILQYLEWRSPEPSLYPEALAERVVARALERLADQRLDPIVVDASLWHWTQRDDAPPGTDFLGLRDGRVEGKKRPSTSARSRTWPRACTQ